MSAAAALFLAVQFPFLAKFGSCRQCWWLPGEPWSFPLFMMLVAGLLLWPVQAGIDSLVARGAATSLSCGTGHHPKCKPTSRAIGVGFAE